MEFKHAFQPQSLSQFVVVEFFDALEKQDKLRLWRILDLTFRDETAHSEGNLVEDSLSIHSFFKQLSAKVLSVTAEGRLMRAKVRYTGIFNQSYQGLQPTNCLIEWETEEAFKVDSTGHITNRALINTFLFFCLASYIYIITDTGLIAKKDKFLDFCLLILDDV